MHTVCHLSFPLDLQEVSGMAFNYTCKHHSKDYTKSYFEVEASASLCTLKKEEEEKCVAQRLCSGFTG